MNTIDSIIKRKSVRQFNNTQITKEQLNKLVQAANAAPISGGGLPDSGSYRHITVIQNEKVLQAITKGTEEIIKLPNALYNAPTLIIISSRENKFNAQQLDSALVAQNVTLAATDLGLNSIIMSGVIVPINVNNELKALLNLPEGCIPYIAIAVGNTDDTSVKIREFSDLNVSYI